MKVYARVSSDLWKTSKEYRQCFDGLDGMFYHEVGHSMGPQAFSYFPRNFGKGSEWGRTRYLKELEAWIAGSAFIPNVLINECFLGKAESGKPAGFRKLEPYKKLGNTWIRWVTSLYKRHHPNTKIWLTDFRPRDRSLWDFISDYLEAEQIPIDGIGIQCHISMRNLVIANNHWSVGVPMWLIKNRLNSFSNRYQTCIPEITIWPGPSPEREQVAKMASYYEAIALNASKWGCEWICYWSWTDHDAWHYTNVYQPCGLYDSNYKWKLNNPKHELLRRVKQNGYSRPTPA